MKTGIDYDVVNFTLQYMIFLLYIIYNKNMYIWRG